MIVNRITIGIAIALLVGTSVPMAASATASENENKEGGRDDGTFVVVMTPEESSAEALFERYPELSGSWEDLAKFNLLRSGHVIEVPRSMLTSDGVLAKVASANGDTEVKRSFDRRFIPVVESLLLREGDELRTWSGSGARILFEDGNYVFVNSHTRVKIVSLEDAQTSPASRVSIVLEEGSIWSRVDRALKGRFEIRTPTATTTIRGTDFRVKVEAGQATRLEVLDGTVDLETGGDPVAVTGQHGAVVGGRGETIRPVSLPPAPASLEAPQPEEVIRGDEFNQIFRWAPVPGANSYHLVIARENRFFDIVEERRVGPEASIRIPSLEPGTYFWRVSAVDASGFEGSFSESRYFVFVKRRP